MLNPIEGEVFCNDKPLHWTSFEAVKKIRARLRRHLGVKNLKVGHAGTLDPLATGVLIVCTGRKTKDGNRITNFIDCVAWRQQAEFACKYLTKGRLVIVDGELTSRTYEDKDGNRRKATEITVRNINFSDSKKDGQSAGSQPQGDDFADPGYADASGFTEVDGDDSDLPF